MRSFCFEYPERSSLDAPSNTCISAVLQDPLNELPRIRLIIHRQHGNALQGLLIELNVPNK